MARNRIVQIELFPQFALRSRGAGAALHQARRDQAARRVDRDELTAPLHQKGLFVHTAGGEPCVEFVGLRAHGWQGRTRNVQRGTHRAQ